MIRSIAIDDEPLALRVIESHVSKIDFIELVKTTTKVLEVLPILQEQPIDLIFLDVQMPDLTGLQFIKLLSPRPRIILTTAYQEYALEGYEYDVTDYLLKPISFDRFLKASKKVLDLMSPKANEDASLKDFIFVKTEYRLRKIRKDDILFIEGGKDYTTIYTPQEKILCLASLAKLQESLPPPAFVRVHKSYIVAMDKIEYIERQRIFIGKDVVPVGDTYKDDFTRLIDGI